MKNRPLFCICMSAVCTAFICSFLNSAAVLAVCCALAFAVLFILPLKFEMKKTAVLILIFSVVMSLSFFVYYKFTYDKACMLNGREMVVECTAITESCDTVSGSKTVDAVIDAIDGNDENLPVGSKLRLYFTEEIKFVPSARFTADISVSDSDKNNKFDGDGVHISAYAQNLKTISGSSCSSVLYYCWKLRRFAAEKIVFSDKEASAFMRGMILGDKSGISPVFVNKFSNVGMSHVMAVSGMHLLFAVLFFDVLLSFFGVGYKVRCAFSFVSVLLFTVMSGFAVSCIRAGIMVLIMYSARLSNRFYDSLTALSLSAFVILVLSPYNIRSASFVLSASAVLGIILLTPVINIGRRCKLKNYYADRLFKLVCTSVAVSLSANIACIPAFVFMFKQVNFLSPLSNIIMILPVQIMFYLGFAAMLLFFIPFLHNAAGNIISVLYRFIEAVTDFEYGLKYTSVTAGYKYFYLVFALFAVLIIGIYVYYHKFPQRKVYPYVLSYAGLCAVLFVINLSVGYGALKVDFVDVGQGNCTVFSAGESAVIVDCGGEYRDKLYETLKYSSVKRIDLLAVTHTDADHTKFMDYLINSYEIDKIIYPEFCDEQKISQSLELARKNGIEICSLSVDSTFKVLDGAEITAFVERAYDLKIDSNTSALYKVSFCGRSVVCPGDMDIYQESVYVNYADELNCDILNAPHHGSERSSLQWILDLYTPEYTVISVGRDNNYGHPDKTALKRLNAVSKVLRTDELSTITFIINKKGYRLALQ